MEREEVLKLIDDIGTCESEADRRTMLDTMRDGVSQLFDTNSQLTATNTKLGADNEKLRSANMDLFLQVGEKKSQQEQAQAQTGINPQAGKKLSYDDLFNEKGKLK